MKTAHWIKVRRKNQALEKAVCSGKWWAERREQKRQFLHCRHLVKTPVENEMANGY